MTEPTNNKSLWQLVVFLILVFAVLVVWVINLKSSWNANKSGGSGNNKQLSEIVSDFNKSLDSLKNQINNQKGLAAAVTATTTQESLSASDQVGGAALIKDLQQKINDNNDLVTTSTSATTTISDPNPQVPSTIKPGQDPINCPQYINCMPTIDAVAPNCQIPVGCENITVIAY